jgi:hypothetical protein
MTAKPVAVRLKVGALAMNVKLVMMSPSIDLVLRSRIFTSAGHVTGFTLGYLSSPSLKKLPTFLANDLLKTLQIGLSERLNGQIGPVMKKTKKKGAALCREQAH